MVFLLISSYWIYAALHGVNHCQREAQLDLIANLLLLRLSSALFSHCRYAVLNNNHKSERILNVWLLFKQWVLEFKQKRNYFFFRYQPVSCYYCSQLVKLTLAPRVVCFSDLFLVLNMHLMVLYMIPYQKHQTKSTSPRQNVSTLTS